MSCACTPPQATTVPKMSTPPHSRSASTTPPSTPRAEAPGLSTPVLLLMAVACGLCAGSNYFNQPLLHSIATQLQVRDASAALIVTLAQVAYAAGLLFLVPLGDMLERRRLITTLMLLASLGLFTSGFAGSYTLLALGTVLTGLFSVAAQVLVPLAATLAAPGRRGRAVGRGMGGRLGGLLGARGGMARSCALWARRPCAPLGCAAGPCWVGCRLRRSACCSPPWRCCWRGLPTAWAMRASAWWGWRAWPVRSWPMWRAAWPTVVRPRWPRPFRWGCCCWAGARSGWAPPAWCGL